MLVRTREELKRALDEKVAEVEAQGELAERLSKAVSLRKLSKWTLRILSIGIVGMPFTAGQSALVAAPLAALTGLEIAVILAVAFLGVALVLQILKDYEVVDIGATSGDKEARVRLRRKRD